MHAWENVRVYSIDTLTVCSVYAAEVKAADFDLSIYVYKRTYIHIHHMNVVLSAWVRGCTCVCVRVFVCIFTRCIDMKSTMLLSGDGYSGMESMFFNFGLCVLHFVCYFAEFFLTVCTLPLFCRRWCCCYWCWRWWWFSEKIQSAPKRLPIEIRICTLCMHAVRMSGCASVWVDVDPMFGVWGRSRLFLVLVARCVRICNVRALISTDTDTHIHTASGWVSEWVSESMKGAFPPLVCCIFYGKYENAHLCSEHMSTRWKRVTAMATGNGTTLCMCFITTWYFSYC